MPDKCCKKRGVNWPVALGLVAGAGVMGLLWARMKRAAGLRWWILQTAAIPRQTALVTGASSGIGAEFARRLAERGFNLILVARREDRLKAMAEECGRLGVQVEVLKADLSTPEGTERVERRILHGGDVDFLVNNAGYDVFGPFVEIETEKTMGLIHCLVQAPVRLCRAALPAMLQRGRGVIVNVSSIGSFIPKIYDSTYAASKSYLALFTQTLAMETAGKGIRVQALCPGLTLSEFHDAPEYAKYHLKERIPRWLWMSPAKVVASSFRALGENQVVCIPGWINRLTVAAARAGLTTQLMGILRRFLSWRGKQIPSQALYHRYAAAYDFLFALFYRRGRCRAVELLGLNPGDRVLLSGVGTGLDLPILPEGVRAVGIDLSADMLAVAKWKHSAASVHLCRMDAQRLALEEASVEAALLNLILSVAPDGQAVFREAWRALKPGGRLVLFDKFAPEDRPLSPLRRLAGAFFNQIGTDINRRLSDVTGDVYGVAVEVHERVLFEQYHLLRMRKPAGSEPNLSS